MRQSKLLASAALAVSGLLLASPSLAQSGKTEESSYRYDFDDDYMVGDTLDTTPALLKLRPKLPRIMLIRPRASFVAEMIKSVELM